MTDNRYDLVLKNGFLCDPAQNIGSVLDLAVKDGKVAAIGTELSGEQEVDCTGKIVSPGFIDIHAHEDEPTDGRIIPDITLRALKMGVTTFTAGNCGSSQADWAGYRKAYDRTQPVNQVLLAGHITLRRMVGAEDKYAPVSREQISRMCQLLEDLMGQGCRGLSFGIRYEPGCTMEEMCALASVVKKHDGLVAAHIRDDAIWGTESFEEFLEIGKRTGVRLEISHIGSMAAFGIMDRCLACVDQYGAEGVDVRSDCYPYDAFCTSIGATTYDDGFTDRYGDDVSVIELTDGEFKGRIPDMETFQKVRREHPEYLTIAHVMKQEEVDEAFLNPRVMVGSDGILLNGAGHPRAAGTFPRFIRQYVYEKKLLSLNEAVAKVTCMAAERLRLDRGTLPAGAAADITVFDPERLRDRATFDETALAPEGIDLVVLGGEIALWNGAVINAHLGRAL